MMQSGKPAVLIECKRYGSKLDDPEISQLLRYFTVTEARFGILTDGITYRFFSDLDQPNVMLLEMGYCRECLGLADELLRKPGGWAPSVWYSWEATEGKSLLLRNAGC